MNGPPTTNYNTPCPTCGINNVLTDADLGVRLNCGSCGTGFIFGEEIVRERNRLAAEAKKRQREKEDIEKAVKEEKERRAIAAALNEKQRQKSAIAAANKATVLDMAAASTVAQPSTTQRSSNQTSPATAGGCLEASVIVCVLIIPALFMVLAAIVSAGTFFAPSYGKSRFLTDNAVGAAANSMESLERGVVALIWLGALICVLLIMAIFLLWKTAHDRK